MVFFSWEAPAQVARGVSEANVDVGAAVLRQPGLPDASVLTAAGLYRYTTSVAEFTTNGVGARTPDDRYTGQGVVSAARYAPPGTSWRWELSGTGSAFGLSNAGPAFGWQGTAREHYGSSSGGAFAGIGGGQVFQSAAWSRLLMGHLGGYLRPGRDARDEWSAALSYTQLATVGSTIHNADGFGYWTHYTARVELIVGAGVRAVPAAHLTTATWGSASAALWLTDHAAVVIAGGRALADVTRGVPSVRYLSAAIRVGARGAGTRRAIPVRRGTVDDIGRVNVRVTSDSLRLVVMRFPAASSVDLIADFTDWQPAALTRMPNGEWTLACVIAPGTHRVAIRVDGGSWIVPPNLPSVEDDFGGAVGLLIVP